ncbi:hypothetical protein QUF50_00155, partial [Thiotrichales bacterium HSG1]|nr:hypothetical protein [Thiotrichales bacterium HSG1]
SSGVYSSGNGGNVLISTQHIFATDISWFGANSYSTGNAGQIVIYAKDIVFEDYSGVSSEAYSTGNAGKISIFTHDISARNFSGVSSDSHATGNASDVSISAHDISLEDGSYLSTFSHNVGDAGNVDINAVGTITITGADESGWASTISSGTTNNVVHTAGTEDSEWLNNINEYVSKTHLENPIDNKGGKGGHLTIEAGNLILKDGGLVSTSSIANDGETGPSGDITIRVLGEIKLFGINPYGETFDGLGSAISARTKGIGAGNAGTISITGGSLQLADGTIVNTSTDNKAQGGNINIHITGPISISGDSRNMALAKPSDAQLEFQEEFTDYQNRVFVSGIYADSSSNANNAGLAGEIVVKASYINLISGGLINTSTQNAGGGNITISSPNVLYLKNGQITTSVGAGKGKGGDITIENPTFVVMNQGQIKAQADVGNGGNIHIKSEQFITSPDSLISASSNLGLDGEIEIDSIDVDLTGALKAFGTNFLNAATHMKRPCTIEDILSKSTFYVFPVNGSQPFPADFIANELILIENEEEVNLKDEIKEAKSVDWTSCRPNLTLNKI